MAWNEPEKDPWKEQKKRNNSDDLAKKFNNWYEKSSAMVWIILVAVFLVLLVAKHFYTIKEAEQGVVLRFGKFSHIEMPGLHWRIPFVEKVQNVDVQIVQSTKSSGSMLTEDENVVNVEMEVQYRVNNPRDYLYNMVEPNQSLAQATDSALRYVIGHTKMDDVLTTGREQVRLHLHGDQSEYIGDRACQDDDDKYRADVFDHELEDPSSAENMSVLLYLRHRCGDGHAACDKQADAQSSYGHHDRIGQEIKEIQELHADDRHIGERSVAEAGQGSQKDHHGTDQQRAGRTVPFEFIREGGHCALRESDRARERREKDQGEEGNTDDQTEAHAGKNLGHGDKHQGRTCTERLRISPGKSEDSRDDHQTGQHGDAGIKYFNLDRGFLDRDFFFHIGTEGDQDTHCYR